MGYPSRNEWPSTLADQGGVWCAECLLYIDKEQYQAHHPLQTSLVVDHLGKKWNDPWTVPVHQDCHQSHIDFGAAGIRRAMDYAFAEPPLLRAQTAKILHDRGLFGHSMILKAHLQNDLCKSGNYEWAWSNAEHILASKSALRWGMPLVRHVLETAPQAQVLFDRVTMLLNSAKLAAFVEKLTEADKSLGRARQIIERHAGDRRKELEVQYWRAHTSIALHQSRVSAEVVARSLAESKRSVTEAPDDYTRATDSALEGALIYRSGDTKRALGHFDQLIFEMPNLPWQYQAMALFFEALVAIEQGEGAKKVYECLAKAQFICCVLGLSGHGHGAPSHLFPEARVDCMPGDLLCALPDLEIGQRLWSRKQAEDIRLEAIGTKGDPDSLWRRVMESLERWQEIHLDPSANPL